MSDRAEPTQAALLGCTHPHSGAHLQTLMSLDEVTGIHFWDPAGEVPEALRQAAGEKLRTVHDDLDSLLSNETIGWLTVSVRNDLAPEILVRCAEAGKPVLAEKPMGRSLAEVAPVVESFESRGLGLTVCFQNRWRPAARYAREWVAGGYLGRLCAAEAKLHTTQVHLRDPRHWLFNAQLSGGGILGWLGCHYLDLLRFISGEEITHVTAQTATLSGEAIDVEDMAVLTLRLGGGALATASFGYLMPGGKAGYMFPGYDTWFGLKGSAGHLGWEVSGDPQALDLLSTDPRWVGAAKRSMSWREEEAKAYGKRPGLEFARDAVKAAQRGEPGPATGQDMLAVWRIIEAAVQSQAEGVRVAIG